MRVPPSGHSSSYGGAPAATVRPGPEGLLRRAAPDQAFFRRLLVFGAACLGASGPIRNFAPSCCVGLRRLAPRRTFQYAGVAAASASPQGQGRAAPLAHDRGAPARNAPPSASLRKAMRFWDVLEMFWTAVKKDRGRALCCSLVGPVSGEDGPRFLWHHAAGRAEGRPPCLIPPRRSRSLKTCAARKMRPAPRKVPGWKPPFATLGRPAMPRWWRGGA